MGWGGGPKTPDEDAFKIEFDSDPDRPPDPAAHAHTTVSPAGSQLIEGWEPGEQAERDARYLVVGEPPRGGEGRERVQRKKGMWCRCLVGGRGGGDARGCARGGGGRGDQRRARGVTGFGWPCHCFAGRERRGLSINVFMRRRGSRRRSTHVGRQGWSGRGEGEEVGWGGGPKTTD